MRVSERTGKIVGVVLAGGRAKRMGGVDKPLLELAGEPILKHILDRLSAQVGDVAINANGSPQRFSAFSLPVVADGIGGFPGPLAGVLAAMEWAASKKAKRVLTVAGDTPFFPRDLCARLDAAIRASDEIAVAAEQGFWHPVFALWPVSIRDDLLAFLGEPQNRKVSAFIERYRHVAVDFGPSEVPVGWQGAFANINTPVELELAERRMARRQP